MCPSRPGEGKKSSRLGRPLLFFLSPFLLLFQLRFIFTTAPLCPVVCASRHVVITCAVNACVRERRASAIGNPAPFPCPILQTTFNNNNNNYSCKKIKINKNNNKRESRKDIVSFFTKMTNVGEGVLLFHSPLLSPHLSGVAHGVLHPIPCCDMCHLFVPSPATHALIVHLPSVFLSVSCWT